MSRPHRYPRVPVGSWGLGTLGAPQPHTGGAGGEKCSPQPWAHPELTNPDGRGEGDRDSPALLGCHPCGTGIPLCQAMRPRRWVRLTARVPRQQHPGARWPAGCVPKLGRVVRLPPPAEEAWGTPSPLTAGSCPIPARAPLTPLPNKSRKREWGVRGRLWGVPYPQGRAGARRAAHSGHTTPRLTPPFNVKPLGRTNTHPDALCPGSLTGGAGRPAASPGC